MSTLISTAFSALELVCSRATQTGTGMNREAGIKIYVNICQIQYTIDGLKLSHMYVF